jgi:hypothetical protein
MHVKVLLMSGVDANTVGALRSACIEGNLAIADLLLQAGADPNAEEYGCSSLRYAARQGHGDIVQLLLQYKANPNQTGFRGLTALMDAAVNGFAYVADILKANDADFTMVNDSGKTALDLARDKGHAGVVLVLEGLGVSVPQESPKDNEGDLATEGLLLIARRDVQELRQALTRSEREGIERLRTVETAQWQREKVLMAQEQKEKEDLKTTVALLQNEQRALEVANANHLKYRTMLDLKMPQWKSDQEAMKAMVTKQRQQIEAAENGRQAAEQQRGGAMNNVLLSQEKLQEERTSRKLLEKAMEKEKKQLQELRDTDKRQMQELVEKEQRLQAMLARADELAVKAQQGERTTRRNLDSRVRQLEDELLAANALAAISLEERVPALDDIELHGLEEVIRMENARRQWLAAQADARHEMEAEMEQQRERMRTELLAELESEREAMRVAAREELVQCEICLDRQKDIAFGCGHQVN